MAIDLTDGESNMKDDLISRQQAIDALRTMQTYKLFAGDDMLLISQAEAQTELMMLPSAQPEIIRCPDCYYNDGTAYCELHFRNVKAKDFCSWAERREDG